MSKCITGNSIIKFILDNGLENEEFVNDVFTFQHEDDRGVLYCHTLHPNGRYSIMVKEDLYLIRSKTMTNEEAMTYLNVIWNRYKAEYEIERDTLDAYRMAIEALSAKVAEQNLTYEQTHCNERCGMCKYNEKEWDEEPCDGCCTSDDRFEPIDDLISRADAIEAVASADETDGTVKVFTGRQVNGILSALPSAEAVQGWIPLSHDGLETNFPYERDGEWVIVTDGNTISVERIKKDAYDHFFPNGRWFELENVIAWMPLPEPYKGGDSE